MKPTTSDLEIELEHVQLLTILTREIREHLGSILDNTIKNTIGTNSHFERVVEAIKHHEGEAP